MRFEPEVETRRTRRISPLTVIAALVGLGMVGLMLIPSRRVIHQREARATLAKDYPLTNKDVEGILAPASFNVTGQQKPPANALKAFGIWDAANKSGFAEFNSNLRYRSYYVPEMYLVVTTSTNSGIAYEWSIIFYAFAIQKKDLALVLNWASHLSSISTTKSSYGKAIHDKYVGLDPKIKIQAEQLLLKNRPLSAQFGKEEIFFQDVEKKGYRRVGIRGVHFLTSSYNEIVPYVAYYP